MSPPQKVRFRGLGIWISLVLLGIIFTIFSFASSQKTLAPSVSGPQVIVAPDTIRLGVAKLMSTNIVFEGAGFKSGDSIFITLLGPNETKVIVAEAQIKPDGSFRAEVGESSGSKLTKAMEILRAEIAFNEKFESVVVISQPPIPEGAYTVKVTSMLSDRTAETNLIVKGPSIIDRLKDWIGKVTGKIEHKKAK
jgi:hypothetical protein